MLVTSPGLRPARVVPYDEDIRAAAEVLGGKGGGKDDVAQGGGTDASRIDEALTLVGQEVAQRAVQQMGPGVVPRRSPATPRRRTSSVAQWKEPPNGP